MTNSRSAFPMLYSFRRCPYAMRARLALAQAGIEVELREVLLKDKPEEMLRASPKGTVPVLLPNEQNVVEESLAVMHWALEQYDPDGWLENGDGRELIEENDSSFKAALDRYKYHTRHPEHSREHYRAQGEQFLQKLEDRLRTNEGGGLIDQRPRLADIAIFPFIRQFAGADAEWFATAPYPLLRAWLETWKSSDLFKRVMKKHAVWCAGDESVIERWALPEPTPAK